MAPPLSTMTTLSTKGRVIRPKGARDHRDCGPRTELEVEETADGVVLRAAPLFTPTEMASVFGVLKTNRPPLSIAEMDAPVATGARLGVILKKVAKEMLVPEKRK